MQEDCENAAAVCEIRKLRDSTKTVLTGTLLDGPVVMWRKTAMIKRIGDFMLEIGTMKEYQVQEVIRVEKAGDNRLFGEIALELGYTNDNAIKRYVDYL